jgi:hypothetical protein
MAIFLVDRLLTLPKSVLQRTGKIRQWHNDLQTTPRVVLAQDHAT